MTNLLEVVGAITVLLFGLIGGTAVLYCTLLGMKLCWRRLFEVEAKTASSVHDV